MCTNDSYFISVCLGSYLYFVINHFRTLDALRFKDRLPVASADGGGANKGMEPSMIGLVNSG